MPQRVVDLLESVQIDEGDRQLPVVALSLADGLAEQFVEETAIG